MKTAKELEAQFGIDSARIEQIDKDACKGVLHGQPGETATGPGRPPMFEERMQQVSFKEQSSRVDAIDQRAEQLGIRRSDYLRQLVENDLACAGML